jgi:hypothetical protein
MMTTKVGIGMFTGIVLGDCTMNGATGVHLQPAEVWHIGFMQSVIFSSISP